MSTTTVDVITTCTCCKPAEELFQRPDYGVDPETGLAKLAVCLNQDPPTVYELINGSYEKNPTKAVSPEGEIYDVESDSPSRASGDIDNDAPDPHDSLPSGGTKIDLSRDDFYH